MFRTLENAKYPNFVKSVYVTFSKLFTNAAVDVAIPYWLGHLLDDTLIWITQSPQKEGTWSALLSVCPGEKFLFF